MQSLFYLTNVICHFLSARLSYYRSPVLLRSTRQTDALCHIRYGLYSSGSVTARTRGCNIGRYPHKALERSLPLNADCECTPLHTDLLTLNAPMFPADVSKQIMHPPLLVREYCVQGLLPLSIFLPFYEVQSNDLSLHNKPRLSSSSSSSSSYICHGVGPLVDPFRSHVSRSLFKGLP